MSIAERLATVRADIDAACRAVGRDPADVALLAASKAQSARVVREAYEAGQRLFGESYVQEWRAKAEHPLLVGLSDLRWHFIGALQRNKAKYLVGRVACIESVGKLSLAQEIARRGAAHGRVTDVLLSVNIDAEPTKAGFTPRRLREVVSTLRDLDGLRVRGLMAIPPRRADPTETSGDHIRVSRLRDELTATFGDLPVLSLGMSSDYAEAIAAGSTEVRVGTAIFGART